MTDEPLHLPLLGLVASSSHVNNSQLSSQNCPSAVGRAHTCVCVHLLFVERLNISSLLTLAGLIVEHSNLQILGYQREYSSKIETSNLSTNMISEMLEQSIEIKIHTYNSGRTLH